MLDTNKGYLSDNPPYIKIVMKKRKGGWKDDRIQAFMQRLLQDLQENKHGGTDPVDYGVDMFKTWREQYEVVYADLEETMKRPKFRTCENLRNALIEQGDYIPNNNMQT